LKLIYLSLRFGAVKAILITAGLLIVVSLWILLNYPSTLVTSNECVSKAILPYQSIGSVYKNRYNIEFTTYGIYELKDGSLREYRLTPIDVYRFKPETSAICIDSIPNPLIERAALLLIVSSLYLMVYTMYKAAVAVTVT
jgi:hypothetical protein